MLEADTYEVAALWSSGAKAPLKLEAGHLYRLDRLEVRPDKRGAGMGLLTLALVARRAIEMGGVGFVLGSVPTIRTRRFYEQAGATLGAPLGWKPPDGLIPYVFTGSAFEDLLEYADGFLEENEPREG